MQTKNYYLSSVVETSSIPPDITSAEKRSELLKCKYMSVAAIFPCYDNSNHVFFLCIIILFLSITDGTVLTLDPKTAHKRISLSEGFTKASVSDEHIDYPDSPERFAVCSQVLASKGFSRGRHYWEVRLSSNNFIGIGLAYSSIDRKGPTSRLGRNAQSWCVEWFNVKLSAWYNSSETVLINPNPKRVGVLLDCEEGTATFYNVADRAYPFHSFVFPFAEAVYPAFWIFSSGSSITLCKLQAWGAYAHKSHMQEHTYKLLACCSALSYY